MGSMFSGKIVAFILAGLMLFGFGTGALHWNRDKMKCFTKKHWSAGEWRTFYAVGRLELRYRDKNYDCDPDSKFDPREYEVSPAGRITPKDALTD